MRIHVPPHYAVSHGTSCTIPSFCPGKSQAPLSAPSESAKRISNELLLEIQLHAHRSVMWHSMGTDLLHVCVSNEGFDTCPLTGSMYPALNARSESLVGTLVTRHRMQVSFTDGASMDVQSFLSNQNFALT